MHSVDASLCPKQAHGHRGVLKTHSDYVIQQQQVHMNCRFRYSQHRKFRVHHEFSQEVYWSSRYPQRSSTVTPPSSTRQHTCLEQVHLSSYMLLH